MDDFMKEWNDIGVHVNDLVGKLYAGRDITRADSRPTYEQNWLGKLAFGKNAVTLDEVTVIPQGKAKTYFNTGWEDHEDGHVGQAKEYGWFFLVAYGIGAIEGAGQGNAHDKNPFEVEAEQYRTGVGGDGGPSWGFNREDWMNYLSGPR
jgi:hypothetical protein